MGIERKKFETKVGGKTLKVETSLIAEQANASVLVTYGETTVLVVAVMSREDAHADFLPLKVDYEEKFYAAGKILGSRFVRREGKASDSAVLAARLIDRTIRPLFDYRIRRDLQVVVTVLSYDGENEAEFPAMVGASLALGLSDIPWGGPAAGIVIAKNKNGLVVNPEKSALQTGPGFFEAFAAGPKDRISMIEFEGEDVSESDALAAFELAQKEINSLVEFERGIMEKNGKPKVEVKFFDARPEVRELVEAILAKELEAAVYQPNKMEREARVHELKKKLSVEVETKFPGTEAREIEFVFEEAVDHLVHRNILDKDRRPDGRKLTEVRQLLGETGLLPRAHGSAIFVRGNTQALAVTTLAEPGAEQITETMAGEMKRRFMLHYNFPGFSVGEIGSFRGPGRREIGHGALAEKAMRPALPSKDEFPYAIRVVSETLSSNGSSSMATVCASSMSLMDAGVPLKKPVAGIAMGLMMEPDASVFKVLTDLQGPEDFYGDMDFKVAGSRDGINAIQLDVKINGLTLPIVSQALSQAKEARFGILGFIDTVISSPRKELSKHVPAIMKTSIPKEKIGMLIGPGGKTINGFVDKYSLSSIDVEEDGTVFVSGNVKANVEQAVSEIKSLTREFKPGEIVEGRVIKILDFGAIVDLGGGQDGMVHVSELKEGFVKKVEDVVHQGDFVKAKVIRVEDGRIGLSLKQATKE